MKYKYKRWQIFGKKLDVPKNILNDIYNSRLSCEDFFKYKLDDKIPISCLSHNNQEIIKKFGIEKCRNLDWELINKSYNHELKSINSKTEDLNKALYDLLKNKIRPINYSSKMKEIYKNRLIDIDENDQENIKIIKKFFNYGELDLDKILSNWELFKNKDLSCCLYHDINTKDYNITSDMLKKFMSKYSSLVPLILENTNIYKFIDDINNINLEKEKLEYIKKFADEVLLNSKKYNYLEKYNLTNHQYKEILKYSSFEHTLIEENRQVEEVRRRR